MDEVQLSISYQIGRYGPPVLESKSVMPLSLFRLREKVQIQEINKNIPPRERGGIDGEIGFLEEK